MRTHRSTYATAGISMVDVYTAFASDDFVTFVPSSLPAPNDQQPLSVANICTFTYMCDPDPVGPDIRADVAGNSLIADTMLPLLFVWHSGRAMRRSFLRFLLTVDAVPSFPVKFDQ